MSFSDYDIKKVKYWKAPSLDDDPVKILSMPNIPRPLHQLAPRTILGTTAWNFMRKQCYVKARYKCEVCGKDLLDDPFEKQAHELYTIDYENRRSYFDRTVCLCKRHHTDPGVHTGRAFTMVRRGNVLMPKDKLLAGAEDIFKQVYEYNTQRKPADEEDLRLFYVYVEMAESEILGDEMKALIEKYNIKFYRPYIPDEDRWNEWRLVVHGKEYKPLFKNYADWEEKMENVQREGRDKTDEEKELDKSFAELEKNLRKNH